MIIPTNAQAQPSKLATDLKRSPAKIDMMPDPVRSEDLIRERAYELYENRGCEPGQDKQDWLRAEQEIVNRKNVRNPRSRWVGWKDTMDCATCENLERAFESRRNKYIEAVSAPYYLVSSALAASRNVDMERAKDSLEDHRSICVGDAAKTASSPAKETRGRNRESAARLAAVVKTYGQRVAHPYEYSKSLLSLRSSSFLQSLTTALLLGATAALMGMAGSVALYYRHLTWYVSTGAGPLVDTLVVVCLATMALEQSRKRSIRRTLELSFLNHHIHNAMTQMIMASELTDAQKQDRYMREAISRISEALFRVGNSAEISELSLEMDPTGAGLIRTREERTNQWAVTTAEQGDWCGR
jgi:Protein of unknown function (DUF2934)